MRWKINVLGDVERSSNQNLLPGFVAVNDAWEHWPKICTCTFSEKRNNYGTTYLCLIKINVNYQIKRRITERRLWKLNRALWKKLICNSNSWDVLSVCYSLPFYKRTVDFTTLWFLFAYKCNVVDSLGKRVDSLGKRVDLHGKRLEWKIYSFSEWIYSFPEWIYSFSERI
jgi:hypothetical protein